MLTNKVLEALMRVAAWLGMRFVEGEACADIRSSPPPQHHPRRLHAAPGAVESIQVIALFEPQQRAVLADQGQLAGQAAGQLFMPDEAGLGLALGGDIYSP